MKKHFIFVAIVVCHNMYGISEREIVKDLEIAANNYENSFNIEAFNEWNRTFDQARKFVLDKSKNFFGTPDQNIVNAMDLLENYSHNAFAFLVTTNVFLSPSNLKEYERRLEIIQRKADSAITLSERSNKKESKYIIMVIALHLKRFSRLFAQKLNLKI